MSDDQLSLMRELEQLPCWPAPVQHIRPLTGLSGGSRLVTLCDGRRFVARCANEELRQQGVNREQERQILCAIHAQRKPTPSFLPQVWFSNDRWLIVTWLEGTPWPHALAQDTHVQRDLVTLMRQFHPVETTLTLTIATRLHELYQSLTAAKQPRQVFSLYASFATRAMPDVWFPVLAHHDVHPGNLLVNGHDNGNGLSLIDWEYAARSPLACELILLFEGNGFDIAQRQQFCRYYAEAVYRDVSLNDRLTPALSDNMSQGEWLIRLQKDITAWQPWCEMLIAMWSALRFEQTEDGQYAVWRDHYLQVAEQSLHKQPHR